MDYDSLIEEYIDIMEENHKKGVLLNQITLTYEIWRDHDYQIKITITKKEK